MQSSAAWGTTMSKQVLSSACRARSAVAIAVSAALWGGHALAAESVALEEIIVTGSLISGTPEDAALPVETISFEEMLDLGKPTNLELVKMMSEVGQVAGEADRYNSFPIGAATVNLRNLGQKFTTVIFNGRRFPEQYSPVTGRFNNIAWIPNAAIGSVEVLKGGGAALAGITVLQVAGPSNAFAQSGGEVIPWLDQPAPNPIPGNVGKLLKWEELDGRLTPTHNFFYAQHYGQPDGLNEATWRLEIGGLVARPRSLMVADLKARSRHEVEFTLECSGNTGTGLDFFTGAVGASGLKDIQWLTDRAVEASGAYMDNASNHFLAFRIDGAPAGDSAASIYVAYNGWSGVVNAVLPTPRPGKSLGAAPREVARAAHRSDGRRRRRGFPCSLRCGVPRQARL